MSRRWVKLLGATIALWVTVLLTQATVMALDSGLWWLASLSALFAPFFLAAFTGLVWSAARQDVGPHQALATMPDRLNPAERDAWAELERRLGGEGR